MAEVLGKQVPIQWQSNAAVPATFANQMLIVFDGKEYHISFYEIVPPPILGDTEEERKKMADSIQAIEAKCVARIVIGADRMADFAKAMNGAAQRRSKEE